MLLPFSFLGPPHSSRFTGQKVINLYSLLLAAACVSFPLSLLWQARAICSRARQRTR